MRCVDVNILVYAHRPDSQRHEDYRAWLDDARKGGEPLGLIDVVLSGFLRIVTHPRASSRPLDARTAWRQVATWLATPVAWIPNPGPDYPRILGELVTTHDIRGNLVPDAALAALAIENGVPVLSADTDFARSKGLLWQNPLE